MPHFHWKLPLYAVKEFQIRRKLMAIESLHDLYVEQLKDIYSAEKQLAEALPVMVNTASDGKLKEALQNHLNVTKSHVMRVQNILDLMYVSPGTKKCKAMQGLIEEGLEIARKKGESASIDAGIIAAAQKMEHYEIAAYGCLRTWAQSLGRSEAASTLQSILDEEYDADDTLTVLAVSQLNQEAV
jgi:ferritin-like metal-binding protein YciE